MIEIHSHILYDVDDGPLTFEESINLIKSAMDQGVTDIIATPHYIVSRYHNEKTVSRYKELCDAMTLNKWDIKLHLGNEIYIDEFTIERVLENRIFTLANSKYLLLELPYDRFYPIHMAIIEKLIQLEYRIILAHVDRYDYFMNDSKLFASLIKLGCYAQFNVSYIEHHKDKFKKWYKGGFVHFVSSDMHNTTSRPCKLSRAKKIITEILGSESAQELLIHMPKCVLNNGFIKSKEIRLDKSKFFSIKF